MPKGMTIKGIDGHADTVQFAKEWEQHQNTKIIVTSTQAMLLAFAHGLVQMEQLGALIFDDCTLANHGHPYCVIMESFWMPLLARHIQQGKDEDLALPRIIGFAGWPQVKADESFMVKRARIQKLNQYYRLFHACLLPYEPAGHDATIGWLPKDDIFTIGNGEEALPDHLKRLHFKQVGSDGITLALASIPDPKLVIAPPTLAIPGSLPWDQKLISVLERPVECVAVIPDEQADQQVVQYISLALMAQSAPVHMLCDGGSPFARQLATWLAAPLVYAAAGSLAHRQHKSFFSTFSALRSSLPLLLPHSPVHWRIPATGALVTAATALPILQSICALVPRTGVCPAGLSPTLRLHTMAIKRVDHTGRYLDTNKHHYACRITLPAALRFFLPLSQAPDSRDEEEYRAEGVSHRLDVVGPLCASRHQAQITAAIKVLRLLYSNNCIDDHLLLTLTFDQEDVSVEAETVNTAAPSNKRPAEEGASQGEIDDKEEAMASLMMINDHWNRLFENPSAQSLYMYTLLGQLEERADCQVPAENPPPDTLCHFAEFDWLHPTAAGHSLSLLTPCPWPASQLMPIEIPVGVRYVMRMRLVEHAETIPMDLDRLYTLMACQNVLFGAINMKQLTRSEEDNNNDVEAKFDDEEGGLPYDRTMIYLVGIAKQPDAPSLYTADSTVIWQRYQHFCQLSKDPQSIYQAKEVPQVGNWTLDWDTMNKIAQHQDHETLKDYLERVEPPERDDSPPHFDRSHRPDKDSLRYDFRLYSMRRLLLHMPVNSLFYRVKKLQPDLNPASPFESKAYPEVTSYAEYMQVRYGLAPPSADQPLVAVKRVENYSTHSHWVCRTGDDRKQQTGRQRQQQQQLLQRDQRKHPSLNKEPVGDDLSVEAASSFAGNNVEVDDDTLEQQQEQLLDQQQLKRRSVLIPEYVRIIPIPYSICRLMLMIPRIAFDLQKQLLCVDFYKSRIPASLQPSLPSLPIQVESLTGPASAMRLDYERMEVLGDSILKYAATISCFLQYRTEGEGKLSSLRQNIISNANLYTIGMERLSIHRYARLTPFFAKLWTPPDLHSLASKLPHLLREWPFTLSLFGDGQERWQRIRAADQRAEQRQAIHCWYPDGRIVMAKGADRRPLMAVSQNRGPNKRKHKMVPLSRHGQAIPPKTIADLVEACIASFYLGPGGLPAAIQFLIEMGMVNGDLLLNLSSYQGLQAAGCIVGSVVAEERPNALPQPASLGKKHAI